MAISSPLKSKIPKSSTTTVKKFQTILFNRTRVKKEIFQNKTILQTRRVENERRVQAEEELEAPDIATKRGGPAQLIAGSAKGFFERILGFLGYLSAGWIINNLPTWISMGKEFIARTQQMGKILGNFIENTTNIFKDFTRLLGATLSNIISFDFLDTSGRVSSAFNELTLSVDNWGTGFEDAIKLITTPLTEGIASGEDAPSTGTKNTDEGAYETPAPYSGSLAPQIDKNLKFNKEQNIKGQIGQSNIDYVQVTSLRGNREGGWHGGMDIGAPTGTYIALRVDCEVVATLNQPDGYGLVIDVWVPQYGVQLRFAHNSSIIIKSGKIPAGTSFARIGSTGRSTGPHIHLEADTRKGSASYGGSMDPSRFVPLISLTKGPSTGTSSNSVQQQKPPSTSQPQQPLVGTSPSSSSGGTVSPQEVYSYLKSKGMGDNQALGITANIKGESGFRIGISEDGGPGVGLFQYSDDDRKPRFLKAVPNYRKNWKGQIDYAINEDRSPEYLKKQFSSPEEAAYWWMDKWERPAKENYTKRNKEHNDFIKSFKPGASKPTQTLQQSSPTTTKSTKQPETTQITPPAQITPTGTPQNQQVNQSLTPERKGQTVIVSQNPSQQPQQTTPYGGGGSSGGGSSPQTNEITLLNIFMKNKLLLDLAYL
jgi:murein DD-endopeptidase MepM/ murein hydrolase activator NlpD